jgi:hypothetical protein
LVTGHPIEELRTILSDSRRNAKWLVLGRGLWIANFILLAGLVVWILSDGRFSEAAVVVAAKLHVMRGGIAAVVGSAPESGSRLALLWALIAAALVTLVGAFITLLAGAVTHRRLRSWFAFTMLVAAWLTMFVAWREFAWQGQRLRLRSSLSDFEAIAGALREDWPTADGERAGLGTFMAYPQGRPRMLLMLTSDSSPEVSAVEQADDGTLGFELRGDESGAWLEWHPAGSTPHAFTGGLEGEYDFSRAAPLGRGWYLVRYR